MLTTINIFFHGLFFFEQKSDDATGKIFLEVKAPNLSNHNLFGGVRGNLANLNFQIIDWRQAGFQEGSPQPSTPASFPIPGDVQSTILQFSRDDTGTGSLRTDSHKGKIKLPWPKEFFSRRLGSIPTFETGSDVGKNITKLCKRDSNTQFGVTIGLQYDYELPIPPLSAWHPNINIHFYFQPPIGHTVNDVNQDLIDAASIFQFPEEFDVQINIKSTSSNPIRIGTTGIFRRGVSSEDEIDLEETLFSVSHRPVSKVDLDKLAECLPQQDIGLTLPDICSDKRTVFLALDMISSANCPSFYVG